MAAQAQVKALNVDATIAELKKLFGDRVSTAHAVREQHGKDISYHEAHLPDAVVCYVDSTIALPILTAYAMARHAPRPLKRLYDRREAMMNLLKEEHARAAASEPAAAEDAHSLDRIR